MHLDSCHCKVNTDNFNVQHEPPCTEPYARWCERGDAARLPPTRIISMPALQGLRNSRRVSWRIAQLGILIVYPRPDFLERNSFFLPLAHGQCAIHSYVSTSRVLVEDDVIAATRLDEAVKVAVMPFKLAATAIAGDVFQDIRVIHSELIRLGRALGHSRPIDKIRQFDCSGAAAVATGQHPAQQAAGYYDEEYQSGEDGDHHGF